MSENSVKVDITFYDSYVPSVKDAAYTLKVAQTLTSDNAKVPREPEPPVSQKFIIRGPRFALVPADIHQSFPPAAGTGVWADFLPMIVFKARALPWERPMRFTVPNPEKYPWLALLVFTQDQLLTAEPVPPNSQQNPTRSVSYALSDVVRATWDGKPTKGPPPGMVGPSITLAPDENPNEIQVNAIDIAAETFAELMPTVKDLPYLAHVREVPTENKEPQEAVHDGWYSALIANRFAVPPAAGPPKYEPLRTNVAHLVSLEGWEQYIGVDAPVTPPGNVRMISLYSWAFKSLPVPEQNFRELMLNLISAASEQGTDLMMRLPLENESAASSDAQKTALERLHNGYMPLSYQTMTGESTFAWYRGPLSAAVTKRFDLKAPSNTSEAMVYDPATGMFDQSYAVAFQTGRSLALADLPFATSLMQWRRDAHAMVDVLVENLHSAHLRGILRSSGMVDASGNLADVEAGELSKLLDPNLVADAFLGFLATDFGGTIAHSVGKTGGFTPADVTQLSRPPAPPPPVPADLAAATAHPAVVSLLRQKSGLDAPVGAATKRNASILPDQVIDWLSQTMLLYGVPFNNLVSSARMLPEESIRFFYVDANWIDALLDGALSVGVQTSRDALLQQLMRDALHRTVDGAVHQVRQRLRKTAVTFAPVPLMPVAGFVLRSAVVSGWPGLEMRAFSDPERTKLITPLRLDRVSPSVMIGIFAQVPVAIEFNEPSEGLVFGREDEGISLRYIPGSQGSTPDNTGDLVEPPVWLPPAEIDALRRPKPAGSGALKIADGLVGALEAKFSGTAPALSPGSLAVEMVKVPQQMLFLPVQLNGGE